MEHLPEERLHAYLDGALPRDLRRQVEEHVQLCPACDRRLDTLRQLFENLAGLPEVTLERDLTASVIARLPARPHATGVSFSRSLAAQWGVVLGVAFWAASLVVETIRLPATEWFLQVLLVELPVLRLPALRIPTFQLPSLSPPAFELPAFGQQASVDQVALVAACTLLLWVAGNLALLRGSARTTRETGRGGS